MDLDFSRQSSPKRNSIWMLLFFIIIPCSIACKGTHTTVMCYPFNSEVGLNKVPVLHSSRIIKLLPKWLEVKKEDFGSFHLPKKRKVLTTLETSSWIE